MPVVQLITSIITLTPGTDASASHTQAGLHVIGTVMDTSQVTANPLKMVQRFRIDLVGCWLDADFPAVIAAQFN